MADKILRFTASWCSPCKMLAKNLEGADLGVPIEVVDIDVHREVATHYGIRSVPTLVLFKNEVEVGRISGVQSVPALKEWITSL